MVKLTEEEKAKELVNKFKDYVHGYIGSSMLTNTEYPEQILAQAKKAAIIVVDEIISETGPGKMLNWLSWNQSGTVYINYWEKVREEINKITELN